MRLTKEDLELLGLDLNKYDQKQISRVLEWDMGNSGRGYMGDIQNTDMSYIWMKYGDRCLYEKNFPSASSEFNAMEMFPIFKDLFNNIDKISTAFTEEIQEILKRLRKEQENNNK